MGSAQRWWAWLSCYVAWRARVVWGVDIQCDSMLKGATRDTMRRPICPSPIDAGVKMLTNGKHGCRRVLLSGHAYNVSE